jgi:hypothetical protein
MKAQKRTKKKLRIVFFWRISALNRTAALLESRGMSLGKEPNQINPSIKLTNLTNKNLSCLFTKAKSHFPEMFFSTSLDIY